MGIPLGHGNRTVAHEFLDPVKINPSLDKPGSERVAQGVEDDLITAVLVALVEAKFSDHAREGEIVGPHLPFRQEGGRTKVIKMIDERIEPKVRKGIELAGAT